MNRPLEVLVTAAAQELTEVAHSLRTRGWPAEVNVHYERPGDAPLAREVHDRPMLHVTLRISVPLPDLPVEADLTPA